MKTSVIIVSYNTKEYLEKCIKSLLKRDNSDKEILVIDNASSDGTPAFVRENFPDAKLILNKENLGFAKAVNQGIKESSGKYILLLNPDTEILSDSIKNLINFTEKHPEVAAVGPKLLNSDLSLQTSAYFFPNLIWLLFHLSRVKHIFYPNMLMRSLLSKISIHFWEYNQIREIDWITGAAILIRREAIREVGFFDENFFMYFEEIDWCKRAKEKGWKIYFTPDASIIHHLEKSSEKEGERTFLERYKSLIYYFRKHHQKKIVAVKMLLGFIFSLKIILFFIISLFYKKYEKELNKHLEVLKIL